MPTTVVNILREPCDIEICRPGKWGNPFTHIKDKKTLAKYIVDSVEEALNRYREYILTTPELYESLDELSGKKLGCFCKPKPCHGDILIELLSQKKLKKFFDKK